MDLDELPHEGKIVLGFQAPELVPGVSLGLSWVEHTIDAASVRTVCWVET